MIRFACLTDPGHTHSTNEDRWLAVPEQGLFLVADGMANDTAPQFVVDQLPSLLKQVLPVGVSLPDPSLHQRLQEAIQSLNRQVYEKMAERAALGLGTTLVLALIREPRALIIHVGDSRVYLYRDDRLQPLTRDHSYIQQLLDEGVISEQEALSVRSNGGPTRFLGQFDEVEADIRLLDLLPGDQLLLCSDGLTELLTNEELQDIFQKQFDPEDTCEELVHAALEAGGWDNITALVIEVTAG